MNFYYAVSAIDTLSYSSLVLLIYIFLTIISILLILSIISWWIFFKRNNQKGWKVIVPFYNIYVLGKMSSTISRSIVAIVCIISPIILSYSTTYIVVNNTTSGWNNLGVVLLLWFIFTPLMELNAYLLILTMVYEAINKFNKNTFYFLFFVLFPFLFIFSIKKLPTLPMDSNNNSNIDAVNNLSSVSNSSFIVSANYSSNNLPITPQPIDDLNQPQIDRDSQNQDF
jgi:hypothetical protein